MKLVVYQTQPHNMQFVLWGEGEEACQIEPLRDWLAFLLTRLGTHIDMVRRLDEVHHFKAHDYYEAKSMISVCLFGHARDLKRLHRYFERAVRLSEITMDRARDEARKAYNKKGKGKKG